MLYFKYTYKYPTYPNHIDKHYRINVKIIRQCQLRFENIMDFANKFANNHTRISNHGHHIS